MKGIEGGDPAERQAKVRTFSIGGSMKNKTLFIAPFLTDTKHHISVNSNPKTGYDGTPQTWLLPCMTVCDYKVYVLVLFENLLM